MRGPAARGPPRRPAASPSSRPRGSWSTRPAAPGSRRCPSRSISPRRSARPPGAPVRARSGPARRRHCCHMRSIPRSANRTGGQAYPAPVPGDAPTVEILHAPDAEDRQRRAAGALLARGCTRGDRVAFALGSSADLICAVLGAARVGLLPVLLNATLTDTERDLLAEDARPALRIFSAAELAGLAEGPPVDLAPHPLTRPMHYTSGTT